MEGVAERIKELIHSLGISNTEFAKRTKLNAATISHILSGRNKASLQVVESIILEFTNVNTDYLITGEGNLYKEFTNVNTPTPPVINEFSFPMEGVRKVSVGVEPIKAPVEEEPLPESEIKVDIDEVNEIKSSTLPSDSKVNSKEKDLDNEEIERIVIFFKNGSFKSYHP